LTLVDFQKYFLPYWNEHPPVHVLVAAYLGFKPQTGAGMTPQSTQSPQNISELLSMPAGMMEGDIHEGLPEPILDFAEFQQRIKRGG
jgi:hypothetical protein